jgi:5-methylcytosine-specific restriction endonuclease McrA
MQSGLILARCRIRLCLVMKMRTNESDGWTWGRIQDAVLSDAHYECQRRHSGCLGVAVAVNHIIARIDGGGDNRSNLEAICEYCHEIENQKLLARLAAQRKEDEREARRRNRPGRKDRYE